jgi:hypothetical protein
VLQIELHGALLAVKSALCGGPEGVGQRAGGLGGPADPALLFPY